LIKQLTEEQLECLTIHNDYTARKKETKLS